MAGGLPRTQARRAAVQALYQSLVNNQAPEKDTMDFVMAEYANKIDKNYFQLLVEGVTKEIDTIDAELTHAVDRSLATVDPVEISVLRLAVFEYMHRPDIPYRVVLSRTSPCAPPSTKPLNWPNPLAGNKVINMLTGFSIKWGHVYAR